MVRSPALALATSLTLVAALLGGCADDPAARQAESDVTDGDGCSATLRILQKDAYKETAGRTSSAWPPHTTTQLDVTCDGELVYTTFQANHGTEPGAVDAAGDVVLVETGTVEVSGREDDLLDLAEAFEACSCDGATTFLGMDSLEDEVAAQLVGEVATYLEANLACTAATTAEVVGWLREGAIEKVLTVLPSCTWADGSSLEAGLDEALAAIVAATGDVLDGHHVCNNDAILQVELVQRFEETGAVGACDAASDTCRGPRWLYTPGDGAAE